jgi:hypothetical protein
MNVTPRARYRHVTDKQDLLRAVADLVLSDVVLPQRDQPWPGQLRQLGLELKRVLDAHPHVTPLCARRASVFPGVIPIADSAINAVKRAGLQPEIGIRFGHAVTNYTLGFSLDAADYATHGPLNDTEDPFDSVDITRVRDAAEQAPFLRDFANNGGYASQLQYLFGLDLLVTGLEAWAASSGQGGPSPSAE